MIIWSVYVPLRRRARCRCARMSVITEVGVEVGVEVGGLLPVLCSLSLVRVYVCVFAWVY